MARGELGDVASLAAGMIGCDVVIHVAAHVLEWDAPAVFEKINVEGTANVLAAARKARVARFVHVGTEAVLVGGGPIVQVDETRPLPEHPLPGYPASKAAADYGELFHQTVKATEGLIAEEATRLFVTPAQYLSKSTGSEVGTFRKFTGIDFRLYYNDNTTTYTVTGPGSLPSVTPSLAGPPVPPSLAGPALVGPALVGSLVGVIAVVSPALWAVLPPPVPLPSSI